MWKPVPSARQITIFGLNTRGRVPPLSQPSLMAGWERAEASRPRHEGTGDMESAGAAFLETAGAKSVPILWGERPGQDLNLRGGTPRVLRTPPHRTKRPGQRNNPGPN